MPCAKSVLSVPDYGVQVTLKNTGDVYGEEVHYAALVCVHSATGSICVWTIRMDAITL